MAVKRLGNKGCLGRLNGLNSDIKGLLDSISGGADALEGWEGFSNEKSPDASGDAIDLLQRNITSLIGYFRDKTRDIQEMAIKDQLTGLYNRHFFNEVIGREATRIERTGDVISFIMLDMDDLKRVNDTLGHLTGDKLIVEGARLLQSNVRKADIVFRFGGDEFLALLVNADCEDTGFMVKRFLDSVSAWNKENAKTFGCQLSFSIGCSTCKNCEGVLKTLNEADERMYRNKKAKKESDMMSKQPVNLN